MSFEKALAFVERQEGGWADDSHDRGGRTRYGIASASHPDVDLDDLTRAAAAEIFRRDYWNPAHCDELLEPLDLAVFDFAVHSGRRRAVTALQAEIGAHPDGSWGNLSRAALSGALDSRQAKEIAMGVVHRRRQFMVAGFRHGTFSPQDPLHFLSGFWKRTVDLTYEIAGGGSA